VDAELQAHADEIRGIVRQLVADRLDALARQLVAEELQPRTNGTAATPPPSKPGERVCASCGERPALPDRRRCGACHNARQRQRHRGVHLQDERPRSQHAASAAISRPPEPDPAVIEPAGASHDAAAPIAPIVLRGVKPGFTPLVDHHDLAPAPVSQRAPRRPVGGRLVAADEREAARERRELIAAIEPETQVDEAGRPWRVKVIPSAYQPPADHEPVAAD